MAASRQPLRLLADDLTGALDSAAAFASAAEPVAVVWRGGVPGHGPLAVDSRSRELSAAAAREAVAALAPALWSEGDRLAFKKVDSLLRGQEAAELATILALLHPGHCIVAPAFPAQGRLTRAGRQGVATDGGWRPLPGDLAADLERAGHAVIRTGAGAAVPTGVSFWDAETDADLDAVVAAAEGLDDVLWVGSGGLAAALARARGIERPAALPAALRRPVLGLVGSEHAAIRAQLARLGALHRTLATSGRPLAASGADDGEIARLLTLGGVAFASLDLPEDLSRRDAAATIEARFAGLLGRLAAPGTLFAAGGETLRGLTDALGAERLDVTGDIVPGVARSILRGGRWDGVAVVSKSGAFGGPDLLRHLLAAEPATTAGAPA